MKFRNTNETPRNLEECRERRYQIRKEIHDLVVKLEKILSEQLGFDFLLTEAASGALISRTKEITGDDSLWPDTVSGAIVTLPRGINTIGELKEKIINLTAEHEGIAIE